MPAIRVVEAMVAAELDVLGKTASRRVIIVEKDQYYRGVLTEELLSQGFAVQPFRDGAALLNSLGIALEADLAVVDWDLPGLNLLSQLRRYGVNVPVVFLTGTVTRGVHSDQCVLASKEVLDAQERLAFDCGAVDYMPKSRDMRILVRRLRNTIELTHAKARMGVTVKEGLVGLVLKPDCRRACWNKSDVNLTLGEYNIVHLLATQAGSFVTYRAVYDRLRHEGFIAGDGKEGFRANVRSAIRRIRNKFRACDPAFDQIKNYTGVGYCWRESDGPGTVAAE